MRLIIDLIKFLLRLHHSITRVKQVIHITRICTRHRWPVLWLSSSCYSSQNSRSKHRTKRRFLFCTGSISSTLATAIIVTGRRRMAHNHLWFFLRNLQHKSCVIHIFGRCIQFIYFFNRNFIAFRNGFNRLPTSNGMSPHVLSKACNNASY